MTLPVTYFPGTLGSFVAAPAGVAQEFQDFRPEPTADQVVFYLRTSGAGQFRIDRVDDDNTIWDWENPVIDLAIPGATAVDREIVIPAPKGNYRAFFTPGGAPANVSVSGAWTGGQSQTGAWPHEEG